MSYSECNKAVWFLQKIDGQHLLIIYYVSVGIDCHDVESLLSPARHQKSQRAAVMLLTKNISFRLWQV